MDDPMSVSTTTRHHGGLGSRSVSSNTLHTADPQKKGPSDTTEHENKNNTSYVDWNGQCDPEHPLNWPLLTKLRVSLLLTCITLCVSLSSSIFGPGSKEVEEEFGIGPEVAILGTSLYLLGFVFGPPFWGPMSEKFGRKGPMLVGVAVSCIWTIMVAVGQNAATIILGRFLTGVFGASPAAIIGGAATDNWGPVARGINLTLTVGTIFGGPLLGPVIGNFVVQGGLGWRWNMWIMVIFGGFVCLVCLFALPETYPPMVLKQKTKRLRKETGDSNIKCRFDDDAMTIQHICNTYLVRPWVLFFTEPILVFVSIFQAFIYGILYLFLSSYPIEFGEDRGWALGLSGLPLVSLYLGIIIAVAVAVFYTRTSFARKLKAHHGEVLPEDRLPVMIGGSFLIPIGLFWYAWTAAPDIPWPSVVCAGVVVGLGMFLVFITCIIYLIDVYVKMDAVNSAMASNSMVRALFGTGFPLFAASLYHKIGTAWATSLLGVVSVAMIPIPIIFYIYGARIRARSRGSIQIKH